MAPETDDAEGQSPVDELADRAAAFHSSMRGCLRGCGTLIVATVVLAVLGYLAVAIYLTWGQHPN